MKKITILETRNVYIIDDNNIVKHIVKICNRGMCSTIGINFSRRIEVKENVKLEELTDDEKVQYL